MSFRSAPLTLGFAAVLTAWLAGGSPRERPPAARADAGAAPAVANPEADPSPESADPDAAAAAAAPDASAVEAEAEEAPGPRIDLRIHLVNAETGEVLAGGAARLENEEPLRPGRTTALVFDVDPPPGYVMEDPGRFVLGVALTVYTRTLDVRVPVWPEARLTLLVTEPDGTPAAGATVERAWFEGEMRDLPRAAADADGRLVVRGLPAIPGEAVLVPVGRDDRFANPKGILLARSTREVVRLVTLPAEPTRPYAYRGPFGLVTG